MNGESFFFQGGERYFFTTASFQFRASPLYQLNLMRAGSYFSAERGLNSRQKNLKWELPWKE